ncbi:hypothetical protein ACFVTM_17005 [Arthrobacter sp. NPDC058130]|uniref:hypothetical protein n=1 Tax=Arthrobacter sp. NPDC058130 TaxID=3346353 RepID=UPI0036E9FB75
MGMVVGIVIFLMLWLGVFVACIILPIVAVARYNRRRSKQPLPAEPEWPPLRARYDLPAVVRLEPKATPSRQQIEAAGPVIEPKWTETYRGNVVQEKNAWDRDFKEAKQLARARLASPSRGSTKKRGRAG